MTSNKTNILIFGKNGQVGQELYSHFENGYNNISLDDTDFLSRDDIDLTDAVSLRRILKDKAPTAILNASAYTAVDKAESDKETADAVNAIAPQIMAEYAQEHRIPFIHISTDYVFDGTKSGEYIESDPICPINAYGQSKADGEAAILSGTAPAVILRTSWVYAEKGTNFVHTMLRLGQERDALSIVSDQIGAPTNAKDIARGILDILPQIKPDSKPQLFHMCAQGHGSWFDFASLIFDIAKEHGIKTPESLSPIPSSAYPTPAARPLNSQMDCSALTKAYGVTLPHWEESAKDTLNKILSTIKNKKAIAS